MSIDFEVDQGELILCYTPYSGTDFIYDKFDKEDYLNIKNTFFVNRTLLRESGYKSFDLDGTVRFCIGQVGINYTQLNSAVIGTKHTFRFDNEIKLKINC